MEDRETPWMHKYEESKTTWIMMATVPHVTAWVGRMKYHTDGFLFDWVYKVQEHKFALVRAFKTCRGSRGIAPFFLNLDSTQRWVVSFMPHLFCLQFLLSRKLGGHQSQLVCSGEEKSPLSWVIQLVSYTLCHLSCPYSQKESGSVAKTA